MEVALIPNPHLLRAVVSSLGIATICLLSLFSTSICIHIQSKRYSELVVRAKRSSDDGWIALEASEKP